MKCQSVRMVRFVLGAVGLAAVLWWAGFAAAQPPGGQGGPPGGGRGPQGPGQPPGGPGGFQGFGGGFGMGFGMPMGFGPTQLLSRPDVRKELELLDDQIKQLDALEQKMRDRMRQAFPRPAGPGQGRGQEGNRDQRRDQGAPKPQTDFRQMSEQINKETRAELEKILLPHQLKRLDQLSVQLRMQNVWFALMGGDVARDLGVTDQQREELRTKVEEIQRETRKQEAELRRQEREKVIRLLSPNQQKKLKDMVGEWFTFEMQGPPQRFGQPGGFGPPQGGPGGQGGPNRGDSRRPQRPN